MTGTAPGAAAGTPARRGRWVLLLLLAAGLTGLVALPTWVVGAGSNALQGPVSVPVSGTRAAPQAGAGALVLLAAAAAVTLVGPVGRRVLAVVVAGAGALVAVSGVLTLTDPAAAAAAAVAEATGVAPADGVATVTAAPAAAVVVGAAVTVLAVVLARASGAWGVRSRRHERPAGHRDASVAGPPDERADWDALSRGDDPS